MKNLQDLQHLEPALNEIGQKLWPSVPEVRFYFHPVYQVFVGPNALAHIEEIFGRSSLKLRLKAWRKLVWLKPKKKFRTQLPEDSVLFMRPNKRGLVLVSPGRGLVLKLFFTEESMRLMDDEVKTLLHVSNTNFEQFTAKLLGHGKTNNGGSWMAQEYFANTEALQQIANPDRYLYENFDKIVMPMMTHFYQAFGVKTVSLDEWLIRVRERVKQHPAMDKLAVLVQAIEQQKNEIGNYPVVLSQIHHDIHAGNILMNKAGAKIIDWEGSVEGLILIDVLDFLRRYLQRDLTERKRFLQSLLDTEDLSSERKRIFSYYQDWMKQNFQIEVPPHSERLSFLIYILERTLMLFENRQHDRMKDKAGIETATVTILTNQKR